MWWVIIIFILILLSAFFSGSEAGLTSISDYKIRKIYNKYKILQLPLKLWVYRPYRILITILVGNTIVNLLISSVSIDFIELPVSREIKEFIIWLIVTTFIIIFGELTPKIVAKKFPESISKFALLPLYLLQSIVSILLLPVFQIIEKYIKKESTSYFTKMDEIKKIIYETSKEIFHKDINELFERATKFDDIRIKDIMTPKEKVVMINIAGKNITSLVNELIETGKTRIPLYDGSVDKIIGYTLVKDLFYLCSTGIECTLSDLIHPILEVSSTMKAKDVIREFKTSQIHIAKVVDENKKFCGIVTLEDVIEEIVGDILDEYDVRLAIVGRKFNS